MAVRTKVQLKGPALVFITMTIRNFVPIFREKVLAAAVTEQLRETAVQLNVSIVAFCVMPSHLHMLCGIRKFETTSRFVQSFKSLSSRRLQQLMDNGLGSLFTTPDGFRMWMPRSDQLVLTSDLQFSRKMQYIHDNPVKAGLAVSATEWPYSSAKDWLGGGPGPIPIDKEFSWETT